jgi:WD40 repeat protein
MTEEFATWNTPIISPKAPTDRERSGTRDNTSPDIQRRDDEILPSAKHYKQLLGWQTGAAAQHTRGPFRFRLRCDILNFSPDGKLVASARRSDSGTLPLAWRSERSRAILVLLCRSILTRWQTSTSDEQLGSGALPPARCTAHSRAILLVLWGYGKLVASGSIDKTVKLWDPVTRRDTQHAQGPFWSSSDHGILTRLADSKLVASASHDTIRL